MGFMVSERGIRANPEKIEVVVDIPRPQTLRDVQKIVGMIVALNRFISKEVEKSMHLFKALKMGNHFVWTDEADQSLQQLKKYLTSPPLLVQPEPKDMLLLYFVTSEHVISGVITKEFGA